MEAALNLLAQSHPQPQTSGDPDHLLIQSCVKGNTHSFRQLYRRHQQKVRSLLFQLCGADELDDLVQDVFLRVWKGLPKLKQLDTFSTWLYRITWNVASDRRRSFAKGREHWQELIQQTPTHHPDHGLTHLHYEDLVRQGLNQLSFEHRTILVLHDLQDIPQKEVAEILSIPTGTVKSRLFHARSAMRTYLQQQGAQI
jgi:RNA polymerase sigma factor (sigma-70 family)